MQPLIELNLNSIFGESDQKINHDTNINNPAITSTKNSKNFFSKNINANTLLKSSFPYYQLYPNFQSKYHNLNENEDYSNNDNNRYITPYIEQKVIDHLESYLSTHYKNLLYINKKNALIYDQINSNDKFFVIKSFTEEDIHKSMKYGVWSSSKYGNKKLNDAFYSSNKGKGGNVYLFFSCNKSGRYCGVAMMTSTVDESKIFELWTQDNKWPGLFNVEWIFIKDVPLKEFNNIKIQMDNGEIRPVSHARDAQEIPFESAKIMMEIFSLYENSNTIFEKFEFYDLRQEQYVNNKNKKNNNNNKINDENKMIENNSDTVNKDNA